MESLSPRKREWQRRHKYTGEVPRQIELVGVQCVNLPSWSIHDETQDELAEERVRLVKLDFLLTDALFTGFEGAEPVDELNGTHEYISNLLVGWTTKGAVLPVKYQRQFNSSV